MFDNDNDNNINNLNHQSTTPYYKMLFGL
ncbi:unnamed protein product, partial [Rotaria sp. Silwood2]